MSALANKLAHAVDCNKVMFSKGQCTCGLDEALVELAQLRDELAEARHVIDLTELTDGQMPSDARARLAAAEFRRNHPEAK